MDMMLSSSQDESVIDRSIQEIYDYAERSITHDWLQIVLIAAIEDEESGLTYGRYRKADSPELWHSFDTDYTIYIFFDAIRKYMREELNKTWERAQLSFLRSGAYDLTFEYSNTTSQR